MPERRVYLRFQLDANRINSRKSLDNMNLLEAWHEAGIIEIFMSEVAQTEATRGKNPDRTRKAYTYIFSETRANTEEERARMRAVEDVLSPGGAKTSNERNDIEIVFNAGKYGAYLITADGDSTSQPGGILGHRRQLKELGIKVLSDTEAVELVRDKIQRRDDLCRLVAENEHLPLPPWIGKD